MATEPFPTNQTDELGNVVRNTFRLITPSLEALRINLMTILLVFLLPSLLIAGMIYAVSPDLLLKGKFDQLPKDLNIPLIVGCGIGITILIILLSIASIVVQLASVRGQKVTFGDVIEKSWPFFWRYVAMGFLTALIIVVALILFIFPVIPAVFFLLFANYVLIDKNVGPIVAIKGSYRLALKNWKVVLAYMLVMSAISLPQIIPVLGAIARVLLSIAYFCLPAILYTRMSKATPDFLDK